MESMTILASRVVAAGLPDSWEAEADFGAIEFLQSLFLWGMGVLLAAGIAFGIVKLAINVVQAMSAGTGRAKEAGKAAGFVILGLFILINYFTFVNGILSGAS